MTMHLCTVLYRDNIMVSVFLGIAVVLLTLATGGYAAELSLTLLEDAVDEVRLRVGELHRPAE